MKNENIKDNKKEKISVSTIVIISLFILCILYIFGSLRAAKNHKLFYIFGYSYSVVPTDSMEPNIHVNDVTLIKNVSFDELKLEDVIVYYNDVNNIFVVHRIKGYFDDGSFKTKGDNNPYYDEIHITEDNYVGKVVDSGKFLGLGKVINNGRNLIFILLILIFVFIIVSELINIYKIAKEKQKENLEQEQIEKERERIRQEVIKELEDKDS